MVEWQLPKLQVAGSNPVSRFERCKTLLFFMNMDIRELSDREIFHACNISEQRPPPSI